MSKKAIEAFGIELLARERASASLFIEIPRVSLAEQPLEPGHERGRVVLSSPLQQEPLHNAA